MRGKQLMGMKRLAGLLVFCVLSFTLISPALSNAAAPAWSPGFPKVSGKKVLMQWAPVKGASEYKVYRSEKKGKGAKPIATVKANNNIDNGLSAGKTFYYSVSAVVDGRESERSAEGKVNIQAEKVHMAMKAPKLVGAHIKDLPDGKSSVGLRWEGVAGSEQVGVNVYRSKTKGKGYAMVGSSQGDLFEDKDTVPGETYYYVVTAVDSQFKETPYSNEVSAAIPAPEAPAPVKPGAARPTEDKASPTKMRSAKLLFSIPRAPEKVGRKGGDPVGPGNALGIAVDEAVGHIYVASSVYGGVLVYDMDGNYQFGIRMDGVNGDKRFVAATGVMVGDDGKVYVTDWNGPTISIFSFAGKPVGSITVSLKHIPQYKDETARNYGIARAKDGTLYITDPIANGVHAYGPDGKRRFDILGAMNEKLRAKHKDRQVFNGPSYITVSKEGDIVFVDPGWVKLMVYGPDGRFKRFFGKMGSVAGTLNMPVGLATGNDGEIFVASGGSSNVQAFTPDGKFLYALCNEKCDGPVEASSMRGICVDSKDRFYVADGIMDRVLVYQLTEGLKDITPPKTP